MLWTERGKATNVALLLLLLFLWDGLFAADASAYWEGEVDQAMFLGTLTSHEIIRGNWETQTYEEIMTDFTAETGGAIGIAVNMQADGTATEMLLGGVDKNIYNCPIDASAVADCTKVGICTNAAAHDVAYEKDASGNVIYYWAACADLRRCDTTGTCENWWTEPNTDNFGFALEPAADGTLQNIMVGRKYSFFRCPNGDNGDGCVQYLGDGYSGTALDRVSFPRNIDFNQDGAGNTISWIIGDNGNNRLKYCVDGVDACTVVKSGVFPGGVKVRRNLDGRTRSFWWTDHLSSDGGLYRCELETLECEFMSVANFRNLAVYGPIPTSTTSSTTTTLSTTSTTSSTSITTTFTGTTSTKTTSTKTDTTSTLTSSSTSTTTVTVTSTSLTTSATLTATMSTSTVTLGTTLASTSTRPDSTVLTTTYTGTTSTHTTTTDTRTTSTLTATTYTGTTSTLTATTYMGTTSMLTATTYTMPTVSSATSLTTLSTGTAESRSTSFGETTTAPGSEENEGPVAFTSYCYDRDFTDALGLPCSDWVGYDCWASSELYTEADLSEVRSACPVSCSSCPEDSEIVGTTTPETQVVDASLISTTYQLDLDFTGVSSDVRDRGLQKSFAQTFGVSSNNVEVTVEEAEGRRLASETSVRLEVVVSDESLLLSIVSAATELSSDASSLNSFGSTLASETGVDTSSLAVTVSSAAEVSSVTVALDLDGNLVAKAGNSSSGTLILESGCVDELFIDEQERLCSDWLGYSCTDPGWLSGERPYSVEGLLAVQKNCLLSCGLCAPADRSSSAELRASCEDDANSTEFCRRWRGIDCDGASNFSFPDSYVTTLSELCPLSCGKCDSEAEAPCSDASDYADELGLPCQDWVGYDCTSLYTGYSELGMLHVQAYCQKSCGFCSADHGVAKSDLKVDVCEDDAEFLIAGTFGCDYFVGKSCTYPDILLESRWLLGPAAAAEWHQELWSSCPVSCGLCEPENRLSENDLFAECQDDSYLESWCESNWEGTDCSDWESITQLGSTSSASVFNATVFGKCPKSCGLCEEPVCEAGTHRDTSQHTCEACELGTYASTSRSGAEAAACTLARVGYYVDTTGSTEAFYCDFGDFSNTTGAESCLGCPVGSFAGSRGSSECEACSVGFYASEVGSSACTRCPFGYYQDSEGMALCQACPTTFTTLELGSTSIEDCVCGEGTYFENATNSCKSCPRGFSCPGGANAVDQSTNLDPTILLEPGMMSLESDPLSAYSCITDEIACPGYRSPGLGDTSNPICQDNSYGVRCGYCSDGYYLDEEDGCLECTVGSRSFWGVVHIIVVVVVLILCLFRAYILVSRDDFPPKVIFFLAISFIQFLIEIEGLPIRWPKIISSVFQICNYFNVFEMYDNFMAIQEECIFGHSAFSRMTRDVLKPLLPAALFLPLAVVYRMTAGRHLNCYFVIATVADTLLTVFVQVAVMVFYAFPTEEMPNGMLFLTYYPRIEHGSDEWVVLLPLTAVAALVYVAGFLAFVLYGLWKLPHLVVHRPEEAEVFAFFGDYRPSMYWWTGVLLLYEVCFALANAVVINPYIRVYLTMVFVICIAVLEISWMPGLTWHTQSASVAVQLGTATILAVGTGWPLDDEEVDMEEYRHVVAVMAFLLIISLILLVGLRLAISAYEGQKSEELRRKKILADTLTWMRCGISMNLEDILRGMVDMDYHDAQTFRRWSLSLRTNALKIAPKRNPSHVWTFASHAISGHLLSYIHPSQTSEELASTHTRSQRALELQRGWSLHGHSSFGNSCGSIREEDDEFSAEGLPDVSTERTEAKELPHFPCKEKLNFFPGRLAAGVGQDSSPIMTPSSEMIADV